MHTPEQQPAASIRFSSLRTRLLLLVLLAVLPAAALILYTGWQERRQTARAVQQNALQLARLASTEHEQLIEGAHQLLLALAQLPTVRGKDAVACHVLFADLLKQYPRYANLGVIRPDGKVFCSALPVTDAVDLADRPYFRRALERREFAVGEYQIGRITQKASINFGQPVLDSAGRVQAVVFAALDLGWLTQLTGREKLPEGAALTVLDRTGTILVRHPDSEIWVGKTAPDAFLGEIARTQGEGVAETPDITGTPSLLAFSPLGGATEAGYVFLSIAVPRQAAFAEVNRLLARNLTALGVVSVLVFILAWVGSDWLILRPVWTLVGVTQRLSAGDLTARTGIPPGPGELSHLVHAFDDMAASLERRALLQKQAEEALLARTQQLEAIRGVTEEITRELDLTRLLQLIHQRAAELVGVRSGALYLWEEATGFLVPRAWQGYGVWFSEIRWRLGEGIVGKVGQRGEGMVVNDYRTSPSAHPLFLERTQIRAVLAEPLRYRDRVLGVITLTSDDPNRTFTEEDHRPLALFANPAAIAIENARLYSAMARQLTEITALHEMGRAITSSLDLDQRLDSFLQRLVQAAGAQRAMVSLMDSADAAQCQLRVAYDSSKAPPWLRRLDLSSERYPEIREVVRTAHPLVIPDVRAELLLTPARQYLEPLGLRTLVILPLIAQGHAIGAVSVGYLGHGRAVTDEDLQSYQSMADLAAAAIANGQLFGQVSRAKAEWEHTFDSISELVAVVDPDRRLRRVNRALAGRLGVTPEALLEGWCYTTLHGMEASWPGCPHADTLATGQPATREIEDLQLGGTFLVTVSPLRDAEGRTVGCVQVAKDITEVRQLEEEARQRQRFEDLSRAKSAFIASMSHELRTPLNSILGFSELLLEGGTGPLTEKQTRFLGHIRTAGKHLLQLISDILDLAKIEAGRIELHPEPLPVAATLEDVLAIARGMATKKGQQLQAEIAPDLPPLQADPLRFKQICFNLLSNAVKFTPEQGTITVTARRASARAREPASGPEGHPARRESRGNGEVPAPIPPFPDSPIPEDRGSLELTVTDTGVGIRAEDLPNLFKEFIQLETTHAQRHEGTGLGLALTKKLVELHGGQIWAESEGEGRGSTFTVLLPFGGPHADEKV